MRRIPVKNKKSSGFVGPSFFYSLLMAGLSVIALFSCDNILIDEIALMRTEAVSPVISVTYGDGTIISREGNYDFNLVSVGSFIELTLTITNSGKSPLTIDLTGLELTLDSDTEDETFTLTSAPAGEVAAGGGTSFIIQFSPESEGDKSATITIPSNDYNTPTYSFTLSGTGWEVVLITDDVTDIGTAVATCGGDITDDGGYDITERGICWGKTINPTVDDSYIRDSGAGTGSYSATMTGLSPGTLYYVRAWASNGVATGYGSQRSFITIPVAPSAPTVAPIPYADGSGKLAGSWTSANGPATYYNVYYSTDTSAPGTANGPTGLASSSCTLTGLENYTDYYVWVQAYIQTNDYSDLSASGTSMVGIPVTGITLDKNPQGFLTGMTESVIATVLPENATNLGIEWSASNDDFSFTLSDEGRSADIIVTDTPTTAAGTVYIYMTSADGQYETYISPTYHANAPITGANAALPGPAGGYVIYDKGSYSDGWRYLEAAPENIGRGIPWSYESASEGNTTYLLGTDKGADQWGVGKGNTETIVDALGVGNYMARACSDYSVNGYSGDWFMPSWGEANHYFTVMQNVYSTYFPSVVWYEDLFPNFNIFVCSSKDADSLYCYVYWFGASKWDYELGPDYYVVTSNDGDNVTRPIREF